MKMTPLRLDTACCLLANWRTDLPRDLDSSSFEGQLILDGWRSRSRHPALRVLRHPEGHEMAWVLATGRVQIRVDLTVPENKRGRQALALYRDLVTCLDRVQAR